MIGATILYIAGFMVNLIAFLFGFIDYALPDEVISAILYFTQGVKYLEGIFPVNTLLEAFTTLLVFWTVWYTLKLTIWVVRFIPGLHKVTHPHEGMEKDTSTITSTPYGKYISRSRSIYRKNK